MIDTLCFLWSVPGAQINFPAVTAEPFSSRLLKPPQINRRAALWRGLLAQHGCRLWLIASHCDLRGFWMFGVRGSCWPLPPGLSASLFWGRSIDAKLSEEFWFKALPEAIMVTDIMSAGGILAAKTAEDFSFNLNLFSSQVQAFARSYLFRSVHANTARNCCEVFGVCLSD